VVNDAHQRRLGRRPSASGTRSGRTIARPWTLPTVEVTRHGSPSGDARQPPRP
jgi:hypothetical protein